MKNLRNIAVWIGAIVGVLLAAACTTKVGKRQGEYVVERLGYTVTLPTWYEEKIVFGDAAPSLGERIIEVRHKAAVDKGGSGLVFALMRNTPDSIAVFFADDPEPDDITGQQYFAKDGAYSYFCSTWRELADRYDDQTEREAFLALSDGAVIDTVLARFVADNNRAEYSNREAAADFEHRGFPAFTDQEVADAKAVVEQYFKALNEKNAVLFWATQITGKQPLPANMADVAITVQNIRYKSQYNGRGVYAASSVNTAGDTIANVIVFKCNFTVHSTGNDPAAWSEGEYRNYSIVLTRDNAAAKWLIAGAGY